MVGVKANLSSYLKHFQTEFKVGSFDQRDNAYRYLQGSLKGQTGKRNIQRISEQDPKDRYQSLHHFISHSTWDTAAIKTVLQEINKELLAEHSYGYIMTKDRKQKKESIALEWADSTAAQPAKLIIVKLESIRY